jgi:imidazolonepropionase-like amidohydrolase
MAFDPASRRCLLFGGRGDEGFLEGTWAWDGDAWREVADRGPPPRWFFGMTTADAWDRVVVFGGATNADDLADTWLWDGRAWSRVETPGPPARGMSRIGFDGEHVVLFGGRQRWPDASPPFVDLDDTWLFDGERWSAWTRERPSAAPDLAVVDVDVLPMTHDTVLPNHAVLVRAGRITAVVPMDEFAVPEGVPVLDGGGRYLLPGLIDFHVHLRAESELDAYARHGVTTIVNMRGTPDILEVREALGAGTTAGPRLFTTGPLVDGDPPIWSGDATRIVTTRDEARALVAEHIDAGYDFVKVYNNLDPDVLAALVEAAHEAGLAVVGHLPRRPVRTDGLRRALAAGIDLIAHSEEVFFTHFGGAPDSLMQAGDYAPPTDREIREAAELIARAGAAVTPNLSFIAMTARMLADLDAVFEDPEFERLAPGTRAMWREQNPTRRPDLDAFTARERVKQDVVRRLTAALHDAGVPLLVGTDASAPGVYPGKSVHVELAELRAAGLDPYAALGAATRNAGDFLAEHVAGAPAIGRVAPDCAADFLIVDADPREDPDTLADPWRVYRDGRIVFDSSRGR